MNKIKNSFRILVSVLLVLQGSSIFQAEESTKAKTESTSLNDTMGLKEKALTGNSIQIDSHTEHIDLRVSNAEIIQDLKSKNITSVHYTVAEYWEGNDDGTIDVKLINDLRENGIAVWLMLFGGVIYQKNGETIPLPVSWETVLQDPSTTDSPYWDSINLYSLNNEEYMAWNVRRIQEIKNNFTFDGIEFAETFHPNWEGMKPTGSGFYGDVSDNTIQNQFCPTIQIGYNGSCNELKFADIVTNSNLYSQWVEFRAGSVTKFVKTMQNAVKSDNSDLLFGAWGIAHTDTSATNQKIKDNYGLDHKQIIMDVDPDILVLQTSAEDWSQVNLSSNYMESYKRYKNELENLTHTKIGLQGDAISCHITTSDWKCKQPLSEAWVNQFYQNAQNHGFNTSMLYEYRYMKAQGHFGSEPYRNVYHMLSEVTQDDGAHIILDGIIGKAGLDLSTKDGHTKVLELVDEHGQVAHTQTVANANWRKWTNRGDYDGYQIMLNRDVLGDILKGNKQYRMRISVIQNGQIKIQEYLRVVTDRSIDPRIKDKFLNLKAFELLDGKTIKTSTKDDYAMLDVQVKNYQELMYVSGSADHQAWFFDGKIGNELYDLSQKHRITKTIDVVDDTTNQIMYTIPKEMIANVDWNKQNVYDSYQAQINLGSLALPQGTYHIVVNLYKDEQKIVSEKLSFKKEIIKQQIMSLKQYTSSERTIKLSADGAGEWIEPKIVVHWQPLMLEVNSIEAGNTPTVSGKTEPNTNVMIKDQLNNEHTTTTDGTGNFSVNVPFKLAHHDVVSVEAIKSSGRTSGIVNRQVQDTIAPVMPSIDTAFAGINTVISGMAEPDTTGTLLLANGVKISDILVNSEGVWSVQVAQEIKGNEMIQFYVTDSAQHDSPVAQITVKFGVYQEMTWISSAGENTSWFIDGMIGNDVYDLSQKHRITKTIDVVDDITNQIMYTIPKEMIVNLDWNKQNVYDYYQAQVNLGSLALPQGTYHMVVNLYKDEQKIVSERLSFKKEIIKQQIMALKQYTSAERTIQLSAEGAGEWIEPKIVVNWQPLMLEVNSIEAGNSSIVSGRTEPNTTILIKDQLNNEQATTTDGAGNFSVKVSFKLAHHDIVSIEAVKSSGRTSGKVNRQVQDTIAPVMPSIDPVFAGTNTVISGMAEPDTTGTLLLANGAKIFDISVNSKGVWSAQVAQEIKGNEIIQFYVTDSAQLVSSVAQTKVKFAIYQGMHTVYKQWDCLIFDGTLGSKEFDFRTKSDIVYGIEVLNKSNQVVLSAQQNQVVPADWRQRGEYDGYQSYIEYTALSKLAPGEYKIQMSVKIKGQEKIKTYLELDAASQAVFGAKGNEVYGNKTIKHQIIQENGKTYATIQIV